MSAIQSGSRFYQKHFVSVDTNIPSISSSLITRNNAHSWAFSLVNLGVECVRITAPFSMDWNRTMINGIVADLQNSISYFANAGVRNLFTVINRTPTLIDFCGWDESGAMNVDFGIADLIFSIEYW